MRYHQVSGGAGSWLAAKVDMAANPNEEHRFVFTDVLYEDADAYRFLIESTANLLGRRLNWTIPQADDFPDYRVSEETPIEEYRGNQEWRAFLADLRADTALAMPELIWLADGRDPWEVFRDERFLGNSRVDPCSKKLKRESIARWRKANCNQEEDVFLVGIGPHEKHRYDDGEGGGIGPRMEAKGWTFEAPLLGTMEGEFGPFGYLADAGIVRPRLYRKGYIHNNCGGFCCKAGHAHWVNRLRVDPDRFAYDRIMEQKMREYLGSDVSMLTSTVAGDKQPLTLAQLESRVTANPQLTFDYEPGASGCGCMLEDAA